MPTNSGLFVGQVGATIALDTGIANATLVTATKTEIWYIKPGASTTGAWTATVTGTTLVYTTTAITDLSIAGDWIFQAYVEIAGSKLPGASVTTIINNPLKAIT